ncbi:E3 ubiquitin-protein ligase BRE1-like 2 [Morella rubra]|uniref:E3 ubiquitin protein ligase n=1 Tax=Morella rubra TaxID=262757 RepID=A0A6A1UNQ5_9ROSI|nr:E3 ubiquitin-protein ligase BRE1-like 2 [Morella rubra]
MLQIEQLQKEKLELQIFLDMYGQESSDSRDLMEIKESECRANSQAEVLRNALDEHSLELRVKAANEAEAACQQRLSAAEAEISHLRVELDASERDVLELTEAIRRKDVEAEAYIAEIETIGQAYEDMQTQNQHLLQQVTERDDYNLKLVSESVKTKQARSVLLSEKQALAKQLRQINASVESLKMRISQSEEQFESCRWRLFVTEAIRSTQEERHLAVNLETAKWELADAEKELKWLKAAVASSEKEYEQIEPDRDDLQIDFENERSSRKKLEEELMELNTKVAEMTSEAGEAAIQKLLDEIKSCKSILKCSVCSDRPKETISVANNSLNGSIPIEIGHLKQLQGLCLSHNNLSGKIPDQISDLTNLEILDLSANQLTGEIPASLANLHFLDKFSIASNKLHGPIPSGTQLQSFNAICYEGNSGLCGPPLPNQCAHITGNKGDNDIHDEENKHQSHGFI